jgi:hypothetical protein
MGKDKHGEYTPPKGKPSGGGRESRHLTEAFAGTDPETENEIAAKYTKDGTDEPDENVPVRHANRHLHKGEDNGRA